jgi:membrane-associated phospholipid phosphatase
VVDRVWGKPPSQPSMPLRLAAPLAFCVVSAVQMARFGVPQSDDRLLLWLTVGLFCACAHDVRRMRRVVLEWFPLVGLIFAYDLVRGEAAHVFGRAHVLPQIWVGRHLGDGTVPVVWLQHALWHGPHDVRWYDYACVAVYTTHFFVTPVLAAVLWLRSSRLFRIYGGMVLTLAFTGLATYALFPAMPPWLAGESHFLSRVAHIVPAVYMHVMFIDYGALFQTSRYVNLIAAIPSLHAAYAMLAALMLRPLTRRRAARCALLLYPLAMGFALVYTGEHYTIDVLLGWAYAFAAFRLVTRIAAARGASTSRIASSG